MKRDYSTFDLLPQKTSLHIDSQVNNLKKVTLKKCVLENKKSCIPYSIKGQYIGCTLIHLKRRSMLL